MKRLSTLCLLAMLAGICLAYDLTIQVPAAPNWNAVAYQGASNTVSAAFGTNNIPDGTTIIFWSTGATNWEDAVVFVEDYGWYPDHSLLPGQGFLIQAPTVATNVTITGSNMPGEEYAYQLQSGKSYFIGHVYPRAGWLEQAPYPYSCSSNILTFPGRVSAANGGYADRFYRWGTTNFQFTLRSTDDEGGVDADNPTGESEGARWRPPGSTTGYQTNGFGDNWIYVGQPIFITTRTNRIWTMFKNFQCP